MLLDPEEYDWDFAQGPLQIRGEPWRNLKRLELYTVENPSGFADSFLSLILKRFPALERLKQRGVMEKYTIQDATNVLGECCHKLLGLSLPST